MDLGSTACMEIGRGAYPGGGWWIKYQYGEVIQLHSRRPLGDDLQLTVTTIDEIEHLCDYFLGVI